MDKTINPINKKQLICASRMKIVGLDSTCLQTSGLMKKKNRSPIKFKKPSHNNERVVNF